MGSRRQKHIQTMATEGRKGREGFMEEGEGQKRRKDEIGRLEGRTDVSDGGGRL